MRHLVPFHPPRFICISTLKHPTPVLHDPCRSCQKLLPRVGISDSVVGHDGGDALQHLLETVSEQLRARG